MLSFKPNFSLSIFTFIKRLFSYSSLSAIRALGSTVVNKASGHNGIPAELFKTLKNDVIKVLYSMCQESGRPGSGHRTGKGQYSSKSPRRGVLKYVLSIKQLHSSSMLARSCLKSCMVDFSIMRTKNFQMSKLSLEKEEETKIKLPTFAES